MGSDPARPNNVFPFTPLCLHPPSHGPPYHFLVPPSPPVRDFSNKPLIATLNLKQTYVEAFKSIPLCYLSHPSLSRSLDSSGAQ